MTMRMTMPATDMATSSTERMSAVMCERERVLAGGRPEWDASVMTYIVRASALVEDDGTLVRVHSDDHDEWGWSYILRYATLQAACLAARTKASQVEVNDAVVATLAAGDVDDVCDLRYEVVESVLSVAEGDHIGRVMASFLADGRWAS